MLSKWGWIRDRIEVQSLKITNNNIANLSNDQYDKLVEKQSTTKKNDAEERIRELANSDKNSGWNRPWKGLNLAACVIIAIPPYRLEREKATTFKGHVRI